MNKRLPLASSAPLAVLLLAAAVTDTCRAALPVYGGPTFNNATGTGYANATISARPGQSVLNNGLAVGEANFRSPSVFNGGPRASTVTPDGWGTLPNFGISSSGYGAVRPRAVNDAGVIVGTADSYVGGTFNGNRGFRFDASGMHQLDPFAGPAGKVLFSTANAQNAAGITVGTSARYAANGTFLGDRATRWEANSNQPLELTSLGASFDGYVSSAANAINDAGVMVGKSDKYTNDAFRGSRAVRWSVGGQITELGNLGTTANGETTGEAVDVNAAGVTVGTSSKYDGGDYQGTRAVRWAAGGSTATELGGLGGTTVAGTSFATVNDVADTGMIIGKSNKYLLGQQIGDRAVYWRTTGATTATELPNLGTNGGVTHGEAMSANHDEVIAGTCEDYANNGTFLGDRAVIWTTAGTDAVIDLNTLVAANSGWTLTEAHGISDTGFVSGVGDYDPDGAGGTAAYERLFVMMVPGAGTYGRGDADLDTDVDFADLLVLAQHYGDLNPAKSVHVGDLNLDGGVNFADLLALAQHYGAPPTLADLPAGTSATFAADWAVAQSLVPEPATALTLTAAIGARASRRRRA